MLLDHLILNINDRQKSIEFYTRILGLKHDGEREPFSMIRVTPDFVIQLAPLGSKGDEHLAFAMTKADFDAVFQRVIDAGIAYGDSFHSVGNMRGPGIEPGSRGLGQTLYFFDPNHHLIEIRHYEAA